MAHYSNNPSLTPTMVSGTEDELPSSIEPFATPIEDSPFEPASSPAFTGFDWNRIAELSQKGSTTDGSQMDGYGSYMAHMTQLDTLKCASFLFENSLRSSDPPSSDCLSNDTWSLDADHWLSQQPLNEYELWYNSLPTLSMSTLPSHTPWPPTLNYPQCYSFPWSPVGNFCCCLHYCPTVFDTAVQQAALDLLLGFLAIPGARLFSNQDTMPDGSGGLAAAPSPRDEKHQPCNKAPPSLDTMATVQEPSTSKNGDASNQDAKRKRECEEAAPSSTWRSETTCKDKARSPKPAGEDRTQEKDDQKCHSCDENDSLDGQRQSGETRDAENVPRQASNARRETAFVRVDKVLFERRLEAVGEARDNPSMEERSWQWNRRDKKYKSDQSSCFDLEPVQLKEIYDQGPQYFTIRVQTSLRESIPLRRKEGLFYGESSITDGAYRLSQEELGRLLCIPQQSSNVDYRANKRRRIHR